MILLCDSYGKTVKMSNAIKRYTKHELCLFGVSGLKLSSCWDSLQSNGLLNKLPDSNQALAIGMYILFVILQGWTT